MTAGRRVLVVEDSPSQAARVVAGLEDAGFSVVHVRDGEEAEALVRAEAFDVVLSDVAMPGIDGYELCRRIKAMSPDLPVVLLTSQRDPIEVLHGLEAGADNFLRKPHDVSQVVARLEAMLHHREVRDGRRAPTDLEVVVRDHRFLITAERQQIFDLLMSSFEDLVVTNRELEERQAELRAAEEQLREQLEATAKEQRRLGALLSSAPQAIAIAGVDGTLTDVSDALCRLLDQEREELVGRPGLEVFRYASSPDGDARPLDADILDRLLAGEQVELGADFDLFLHSRGELVPVIAQCVAVHGADGEPMALMGIITEIGRLSAHDSLTRLPHQALFADHVARALDGTRTDRHVAVVAVAFAGFGWLSSHLEPREVERLLTGSGERIRAALADPEVEAPNGAAGYFGPDVFALVLDDLVDEVDALSRAERVHQLVSGSPLAMGDHEVQLQLGVGLAVAGPDEDPVRLISSAVAAARRGAATGGGPVETADPAVDAVRDRWLQRHAELRTAIASDQLVVHYQPTLDLLTGAPTSVEALVRWQHPTEGLLGPDRFLPLAEASGLVVPLGWRVLELACEQVAHWRQTLPAAADLRVSVNVDVAQVVAPGAAERVASTLETCGLPPSALVLEITERTAFSDDDRVAERLRELKGLGVSIAIDDFGTGYSSLLQLRRLPVDFLKVDQSFVGEMTYEPEAATIVAATIRMGRGLGLDTIAEGVETEEQLVQLRLLGCDMAQGYLWSHPLDADALAAWLDGWHPESLRPGASAKVAREPEGSSATVDDVLAYLIHELRSPLAVIGWYADMVLERAEAGEPVAKVVEPIQRSARDIEARLATLADVRDAAAGSIRLVLVEIDVTEAVSTLVEDLRTQLAPHPVHVEAPGPVLARVDPQRLGQAVTNLLVNAARYSPADQPIEVTVAATEVSVEVHVRDHGAGIPPERRPELFRRFARLGARGAGSGVGLHLVRAIARAHGGEVAYDDAPGGGARFVIALPRRSAGPSPVTTAAQPGA